MSSFYVIVSETNGIYLADACWSNDKHGYGIVAAPTWHKAMAVFLLKRMIDQVPDAHIHEVYPDITKDNLPFASEEACVAAGLKRWDAFAYKG